MKKHLKLIAVVFMLSLCLTGLQAQTMINPGGGNSADGSVSYSVGYVAYQTILSDTNVSISDGVQQPYEIYVESGVEEANEIVLSASVYPNPVSEFLLLELKEFSLLNLSYQVIDVNGKFLQNDKITNSQTSISMSNLMPGMYFVKVFRGNETMKTFKVIKK